jgi:hypothetical protein
MALFFSYCMANNLLASSPCLIVLESACEGVPGVTKFSLAVEMNVDSGVGLASIFLTKGLF